MSYLLTTERNGGDCPNNRIDNSSNAGPFSFIGCCWGTPTSKNHGGAICLDHGSQSSKLLSIIGCTFENIRNPSYDGGALYIRYIGSVNISSSIFEHLNANYHGAGYIYNIGQCVLIHNCLFNDCNTNNSYGGIYVNTYTISIPETECVNHSSHGTIFGSVQSCVFD
jgi:hypothetical protein